MYLLVSIVTQQRDQSAVESGSRSRIRDTFFEFTQSHRELTSGIVVPVNV